VDFVGIQRARLFRQHHRNVVTDGIGQPASLAHQFVRGFLPFERAFADRADENFKKLGFIDEDPVSRGGAGHLRLLRFALIKVNVGDG